MAGCGANPLFTKKNIDYYGCVVIKIGMSLIALGDVNSGVFVMTHNATEWITLY